MRLDITNLNCFFNTAPVVQNIHLSVTSGEHLAIVGGNGSGKTTLLRTIIGLHHEWTGDIRANGVALGPRPSQPHPLMVWMPQRQPRGEFPFTVQELLFFSPSPDRAHDFAHALGLASLLTRPMSALSGGQLQRAFLARALSCLDKKGTLLLADEPTAALDFEGQEQVAGILTALESTMIVVTHDLALARKCQRVLHMAGGTLREARP